MKFIKTSIPEVIVVEPQVFGDHRGFFLETWEKNKFKESGIDSDFVQDNHSKSSQGTLRGLHYQIQHPQGKLIRVIQGEIYDVAVDIRKNSPTFGQWSGEYLTAENKKILWIPPGFAHGFYVITTTAEVCYKCTDYYFPQHERCILWNDSELAIDWPLINNESPTLSRKDREGVLLKDAEIFA